MKALRHLGLALWLALAVVAGQQLMLLHDFAHAAESLAQKHDPKPAPAKCDHHYATSQLVGAAACGPAVAVERSDSPAAAAAARRTHLDHFAAYLSTGPPALL